MSASIAPDGRADVVVLGGGGAGLSAAIEAATAGRSVIVLEKADRLGGSTAWSVGSVSATLTPQQLRHGIKDRPKDHFEDLEKLAGRLAPRDNPRLRQLLVDNAPDMFRWLMALGVEFYGPMPEPPNRRPRMHNVLPNSRAFIDRLGKRARDLGVDVRVGVRATAFEQQNGRVVGVLAETSHGPARFEANGGVVLTTGDFGGNAEMKARYISADAARVDAVNGVNTGDGHLMALALGAQLINGDLAHGPEIRFVPPQRRSFTQMLPPTPFVGRLSRWMMEYAPAAILRPFLMSFLVTTLAPSRNLFSAGAVLVNKLGHRFATNPSEAAAALANQPDKIGYIVMDGTIAAKFEAWPHFISTAPGVAYAYLSDYRRGRRDIFHTAPSLTALAQRLGMTETALASAAGNLTAPPFIALGPVKSYIIFTDGGLAVNETLQVLGPDDQPIPGLYAAGAAGQGGLLLEGHGHHLGWAFTSGRIAGRNAALETVTPESTAAG
jgi:succinate dehydrogenase/fumarate reductase flavoprotein subunit